MVWQTYFLVKSGLRFNRTGGPCLGSYCEIARRCGLARRKMCRGMAAGRGEVRASERPARRPEGRNMELCIMRVTK